MHYLRSHHQEATDIYKRLLLENREDLALNVYVAMCYYKLDYYDVSLEILAVYLQVCTFNPPGRRRPPASRHIYPLHRRTPRRQAHPDSAIGVNLKACNHFRLYNGKAAEAELKVLMDKGVNIQSNELIRHNLVVFTNGEHAIQVRPSPLYALLPLSPSPTPLTHRTAQVLPGPLFMPLPPLSPSPTPLTHRTAQVLPPLVDAIPEARLNLVIYHLRHDAVNDAYELVRDLEPTTPQEYIIKGVVHATIGQATGSREHLKIAQQCFQLVGTSAHECDTIPGRQCMASCFYLMRQFEDVNIYMNSIKVRAGFE